MSSMAVSLSPIETERNLLSDSILNGATLKHKLKFVHSMVDEKSRKDSGLQLSGSIFICDVCDADNVSTKEKLGTFKMNGKIEETKNTAEIIRRNPDKLSKNEPDTFAKGSEIRSSIKY